MELTDNMRHTLGLIAGGPKAVRELTQPQRNAARALKERGLVEWSLNLSKWVATPLGIAESRR